MNARKLLAGFLSLILLFSLTACGSQNAGQATEAPTETSGSTEATQPSTGGSTEPQGTENDTPEPSEESSTGSHVLVVYFSHTGENYNVGVIEKGNTHIIADMIAEETGADLFEIQPVNPYPTVYRECTDVAQKEQRENARPAFIGGVENMAQYDTVFIGYPIWWGDLPMIVYTFLESYDFAGKTVIPFCTHEGSGLSGTGRNVANACPGAEILDGLAVRGSVAQNQQEEAENSVRNWLAGLGY